jgi:hypothetical protein
LCAASTRTTYGDGSTTSSASSTRWSREPVNLAGVASALPAHLSDEV